VTETKNSTTPHVNNVTRNWVLISTILTSSMAYIDSSALGVALDALQKDLQALGADLLWIVNGYTLMLASLILIGGSLGDRFGRKRVLGIGVVLFSLASCVCGLAPNTTVLIVARVVQGIGGALLVPGSLAIISAMFSDADRGKSIGTWASVTTLATLAGPVFGGWLASNGLWRWLFFINIPLALVSLYGLTQFPESKDESATGRLDIPGALLVTIGLASLTYGAIEFGQRGSPDLIVDPLIALVVAVITLIAFVIVESRSANPMLKLSLFKSRTFSGTNLMTLFLYAGLAASLFFLPLNLIQVQGYDPTLAGFSSIPTILLLSLLSPYMGRVVDRYGPRIPLTIGPIIAGVGFFLLSLPGITDGPSAYFVNYLPGILAIGIGMGITVTPLTTAVMGAVSSGQSGIASGINNAVARSAQVLAVAILGAIALLSFSNVLRTRTIDLPLTAENRQTLDAEAANFGNTKPPDSLDENTRVQVTQAIRQSFVHAFRQITIVAAVLAWISAVVSFILVEPRVKKRRS
jgi:EmrB/QacA subfamily drug resistance transporter